MPWWKFVKYNNAVPVIISLLVLSAGSAFAASPAIRSDVAAGVLSSETKVLSVDNTYLVGKNLDSYTPRITITGVSEDNDFYYVNYSLNTIDIKDSVWQDITKGESMKVQKEALNGKDLGVYVTHELVQRVGREMELLRETQQIEKAQVSQKIVATAYGGLIGKFLDDTTETLPGYVPVVDETVSAAPSSSGDNSSSPSSDAPPLPQTQSGGTSPTVQILGNNPARLAIGDSYIDLGAVATDSVGHELGYTIFLDGVRVQEIRLDTKTYGVHTITYITTATGGSTAEATRSVVVGTPPPVVPDAPSTPATASSSNGTL
ncbi:MAG: DUF5011 domain-containing protein [Candidatus Adlerbacteria bacterium]|nr:DUF5011 domain-containing protein [Candidatus Adlerbacteria bacterium]